MDFFASLLAGQERPGQSPAEEIRERLLAGIAPGAYREETLQAGGPDGESLSIPVLTGCFWTPRQRAGKRLHEIAYRACFKPALPRFFIERLSMPGDAIYDPFMGRGTTLVEAALMGRIPLGNDLNPLAKALARPRLQPPEATGVQARLCAVFDREMPKVDAREHADLLVFYHPETLAEILALRGWLREREESGAIDSVDEWIRLIALNRLTGHSPGFFSVYTLPPNQAASPRSQARINARRGQTPPRRDTAGLILRKSRVLLGDLTGEDRANLAHAARGARYLTCDARRTPALADASVRLIVTSPPFLDTIDYAGDNWLRGWFCGYDTRSLALTVPRSLSQWEAFLEEAFAEFRRVLAPGGWIAFEVGEVRAGKLPLEHSVIRAAAKAGLSAGLVLINAHTFTKTAHCWGIANGRKGTNSNRVVLLQAAATN